MEAIDTVLDVESLEIPLDKAIFAMFAGVSDDITRPQISALQIEVKKNSLEFLATTGHIMCVRQVPLERVPEGSLGVYQLSLSEARQAAGGKVLQGLSLVIGPALSIRGVYTRGLLKSPAPFKYETYKSLAKGKSLERVRFNFNLLVDIVKASGLNKRDVDRGMDLAIFGEGSPFVVRFVHDDKFEALLMPMRV